MTHPKSKTDSEQRGSMQHSNSLVLGIDTGGTYTDGVLLEYDSRRVVAAHKSLTTKRDFSIGVEAVLDGINITDPAAIQMVSISTTLATNAIAEGKGKRVALLLIGYDPDLVATFKLDQQFATPRYYYFEGGHDLYGREKEALDLPAMLECVAAVKDEVDAIAISGYFSPLNPDHENRAYRAIAEMCDLPIVLGSQLSTKLGSVERATTSALNASLLAVLQAFAGAVRRSLARRCINAPLMVVRGDGTLMSDDFAARTPVETIHSGPAASAMGGRFLSGLDEGLVIDIGGTTTDIALIRGGQVAVSEAGATVNGYKTAIQAANLLSIALGGDSHITLNREQQMTLGPERVTPLAYLAQQFPQVRRRLERLSRHTWEQSSPDWLEYWFLLRQPSDDRLLKTARQRTLFDFLSEGPQPVPEILKRLDLLHVSQLDAGALFRQEIIGRAGLTPTDLLHVEGRYLAWDAEAAALALETFSRLQGQTPAEVRHQVWNRVTETLVGAVVTFLSGKTWPSALDEQDMGRWFFHNSLYATHPDLETGFRLRLPIIGLGAPADIFLKDVAALLHTDLILPEYHAVANAIGAIAGSVMATAEILVYPSLSAEGLEVTGYYVQGSNGRETFEESSAALERARALGRQQALDAALRAGAESPQVVLEEEADGLDSVRIRAKAMGAPRLGRL